MKHIFAILSAILLMFTYVTAENNSSESQVLRFASDSTSGYTWSGFIIGGDSVSLESESENLIYDDNPNELYGVDSETIYTVTALKPGNSVLVFRYEQANQPEDRDLRAFLAVVDENMSLHIQEITDSGMLKGTALSVDSDEHAVLVQTESFGEVLAYFDSGEQLPVQDETVILYTDGTMTRSIPGHVNVLAWESIPNENARISK